MNSPYIGGGGAAGGAAAAASLLVARVTASPTSERISPSLISDALSHSRDSHRATLRGVVDSTIEAKLASSEPYSSKEEPSLTAEQFMEGDAAKRFAHIVGDSFIGGTALEGSSLDQTSAWQIAYLKTFCPEEEALIKDFEGLHARSLKVSDIAAGVTPTSTATELAALSHKTEEFATTCMEEVKSLAVGQRVLLPGGWKGQPLGHLMLYEIIKTGENSYTFNVYNTGAGTEIFHSLMYRAGKKLISPLTSFQGIPLEVLFQESRNDPTLLRELLEPQLRDVDMKVALQLIYQDILADLYPFHKPNSTDFATPQRSGTCGYSCLTAYTKMRAPSKYKALQLRIKVQELKSAFDSLHKESLFGESPKAIETRLLLQKGAEFIIARLAKTLRSDESILPEEELLQMLKDARFIEKTLLDASLGFEKKAASAKEPSLAIRHETLISPTSAFVLPTIPGKPTERPGVFPEDFAPITTPEEMRTALVRILPSVRYSIQEEIGRISFLRFVKALPAPEVLASWPADLDNMEKLHDCLQTFCRQSIIEYEFWTFREKLAVFKLYALEHAMAVALDTAASTAEAGFLKLGDTTIAYAKLDRYKCGAQFALEKEIPKTAMAPRLGFRASDPEEDKEASHLFAYFASFNEAKEHYAIANPSLSQRDFDPEKIAADERSYWKDLCVDKEHPLRQGAEEVYESLGYKLEDGWCTFLSTRSPSNEFASTYDKSGLSHLRMLREAAFSACSCFCSGDALFTLGKTGSLELQSNEYQPIFNDSYYSGARNYVTPPLSEESALMEPAHSTMRASLRELLRSSTTGHVAPHLILAHMTDKAAGLSDHITYMQAQILLFSPSQLEHIAKDASLIPIAEEFIAKALDTFFITRQAKPDMTALLTTFDLVMRLRMLTKKPVGKEIDPIIDQLYSQAESTAAFNQEVHYFLTELMLKKELFAPVARTRLALFSALWLRYLNLESTQGIFARSPLRTQMMELAADRLKEIDRHLAGLSSDELTDFVKELSSHLGFSIPPPMEIIYKHPLTFEIKYDKLPSEKIILGNGQFLSYRVALKSSPIPRCAKTTRFKKIFDAPEQLAFTSSPFGTSFSHPRLGKFFLNSPPDADFAEDLPLYFQEDVLGLARYLPPEHLPEQLPAALRYDYLHWVLRDNSLLICSKEDNKPLFIVAAETGVVYSYKSHKYDPPLALTPITTKSYPLLTRIENPEFITALTSPDGLLQEVSFPRLHMAGEEISFKRKGDELLFSTDDRYCLDLSPSQRPAGGLHNYVVLHHRFGGPDKLLVPLQPLEESKALTSEAVLFIPPPPTDLSTKTSKTISCALFSLTDDGLKSEDNKGSFFLALLQTQSKNYEKASRLLRSYNLAEPLTKEAEEILLRIVQLKDNNPNCAAVKIAALLIILYYRHNLQTVVNVEGAATSLSQIAPSIISDYLEGMDKVSVPLRIEEHEFLSFYEHTSSPLLSLWAPSFDSRLKLLQPKDHDISLTQETIFLSLTSDDKTVAKVLSEQSTQGVFPASFKTAILPSRKVSDLWLTKISDAEWPGFLSLYQYASTASPHQKRLFMTQIRCYLDAEAPSLNMTYRYLLKTLLVALASGEALFPPPTSSDEIGPFMTAYLNKTAEQLTRVKVPASRASGAKLIREHLSPLTRGHYLPREKLLEKKAISLSLPPLEVPRDTPFVAMTPSHEHVVGPVLTATLRVEDSAYSEHIAASVASFNEEIEEGRKLLSAEPVYALKSGSSLEGFQESLLEQKSLLEAKDLELTGKILELANTTVKTHEALELATGRRRLLGMEDLYFLFLESNAEAFKFENSHLTDEDIAHLQQMLFESLLLKTALQHIDRQLPLIESGNLQAIARLAAHERAFDPLRRPEYLVFEYFSNIRLYPQQTALLEALSAEDKEGHFVSGVGQLMMGGGKTKVLSTLLLFASTRQDHLPLLVVPSSQYQIVYQDLNSSLRTNFDRVVVPVEFTREQLTPSFVNILEMRLKTAMALGQVVLIKSEALQSLRLQYIAEHEAAHKAGRALSPKGQVLGSILTMLREKADALIDEVHLVLAQKQEVNFPIGSEILVDASHVDTLQTIFQAIGEDETFSSLLTEDRQSLLSEEEFKALTNSLITRLLDSGKLGVGADMAKDRLRSYLHGEEAPDVEEHLAKLYSDPEKSSIANQLALCRYILSDLLLKNFKRSCGRHFGPLPAEMAKERDMPAGKIVPYQAVGTPATTVFASWEEEVVFGFMTAFRLPLSPASFDCLIEKIKSGGLDARLIHSFNKLLKDLTKSATSEGLSLFDMDDPKMRTKALEIINSSLSKKLALQAEFLKFTVNFHNERICSTPQDWDLPTMRGLSGTPYNRFCYVGGMSSRLITDKAVEGKIVATCFAKASRRPDIVHTPETTEAGAMLRGLIRDETKERIHGLQDPGGLFKKQDNLEVAKAFNEVIKDLGLKGTVFFWRKPGMATADQLAFLPLDGDPIPLKGSSREALREQGIDPESIFIYYDERHCTGTDLPQPPNSINFITVDITQDITTTLQSILRLRQYVTGAQEVEFVIPKDRATKMPTDLAGLFSHLVTNLAIDQSKQFYQALAQRVDAVFKEAMLHELLSCRDESERFSIYEQLRSYYVESTQEDPFTAYGATPKLADPLDLIKKRIKDKWSKSSYKSPSFRERVERGITKLLSIESEEVMKILPKKVASPTHIKEGSEDVIEKEMGSVKEQQAEIALELFIEKEFDGYQTGRERRQNLLAFDIGQLNLPPDRRDKALAPSLSKAIHKVDSAYSSCFDDNICVSRSFTDPENPYSIFDKLHKPAHQILVEQDAAGAWSFTLVSGDDADKIKTSIDSLAERRKQFWLIDDRGNFLVAPREDQPANPLSTKEVQRALIQIAAFNGNVSYLLENKKLALDWLNTPAELAQAKKKMIALKALQDPSQVLLLRRSPEFNPSTLGAKEKAPLAAETGGVEKITEPYSYAGGGGAAGALAAAAHLKFFDDSHKEKQPLLSLLPSSGSHLPLGTEKGAARVIPPPPAVPASLHRLPGISSAPPARFYPPAALPS